MVGKTVYKKIRKERKKVECVSDVNRMFLVVYERNKTMNKQRSSHIGIDSVTCVCLFKFNIIFSALFSPHYFSRNILAVIC